MNNTGEQVADDNRKKDYTSAGSATHSLYCRIAQQQADQRGDDGYSDGVDKRVHRFGVHHELAEVGQRKRPSVVRKGIEHDEQQRYYDKYKQKQRVGYRPVAPAHEEMG